MTHHQHPHPPAGSNGRTPLAPPGRRSGEGSESLLPYLLLSLASRPMPGPPGGVERRARPRHRD